jgi:hypothetical protein
MGLNIKNEAVENNIRELARLTKRSLTDAVAHAVEAELARAKADRSERLARIDAIVERVKARGIERWWKDGEDPAAFLYDEDGFPK